MSRPSEVYVRPLSPQEQEWVHRLYQQTSHVGVISRCHSILLSAQHSSLPQLAALLFNSEDTVARCIHEFHHSGWEGIWPLGVFLAKKDDVPYNPTFPLTP
jgi:hypothetical protein